MPLRHAVLKCGVRDDPDPLLNGQSRSLLMIKLASMTISKLPSPKHGVPPWHPGGYFSSLVKTSMLRPQKASAPGVLAVCHPGHEHVPPRRTQIKSQKMNFCLFGHDQMSVEVVALFEVAQLLGLTDHDPVPSQSLHHHFVVRCQKVNNLSVCLFRSELFFLIIVSGTISPGSPPSRHTKRGDDGGVGPPSRG